MPKKFWGNKKVNQIVSFVREKFMTLPVVLELIPMITLLFKFAR
jgi:hypothetical protein